MAQSYVWGWSIGIRCTQLGAKTTRGDAQKVNISQETAIASFRSAQPLLSGAVFEPKPAPPSAGFRAKPWRRMPRQRASNSEADRFMGAASSSPGRSTARLKSMDFSISLRQKSRAANDTRGRLFLNLFNGGW